MAHETRLRSPLTAADHWEGPRDARVILLEYGDYECPHCGRAYPIVKRVQKSMGGALGFVFRNFPLTQTHPQAQDAAQAAEAAGLQGRFWEMHNLLFENQQDLGETALFSYADGLGLDLTRFALDMRSPRVERKIAADFESGIRSGVNGTPTFFINGLRYDGDWSHPVLARVLHQAASQAALRA